MFKVWERLIWWLSQGQNAAAVQALTSTVTLISLPITLVVAVGVPWYQRRCQLKDQKLDADKQVRSLRTALREEVLHLGHQCLLALDYWANESKPLGRSLAMPSLIVFESNASKIGILTRAEASALIGLAGSRADLVVVEQSLRTRYSLEATVPNFRVEGGHEQDRIAVQGLLKSACRNAADFCEACPEKPFGRLSEYNDFISRLRKAAKPENSQVHPG